MMHHMWLSHRQEGSKQTKSSPRVKHASPPTAQPYNPASKHPRCFSMHTMRVCTSPNCVDV